MSFLKHLQPAGYNRLTPRTVLVYQQWLGYSLAVNSNVVNALMTHHQRYRHWSSTAAAEEYHSPKSWQDRFKSEKYFLEKIIRPGVSILDVGSAIGSLYHALTERFGPIVYTGLDVSKEMTERAAAHVDKKSTARFVTGNIIDPTILQAETFDVVLATGVFQHEPEQQKLLAAMIRHCNKGGFVLFDVKLFANHPTVKDREKGYCDFADRLYYIVLAIDDLWKLLDEQGISNSSVYGYYSTVNPSVRLPETVKEKITSAHILIEKKDTVPNENWHADITLPRAFFRRRDETGVAWL